MKKLYVVAIVALGFVACGKKEIRHCWACGYTKTTTDPNSRVHTTTVADSVKLCDMTEEELRIYEGRYKARELAGVKYSDMHCNQLPDAE